MKYRSFCIAGFLMVSLSAYAQVDNLEFWKKYGKLKESEANRAADLARGAKLEADRWRYLLIANEISAASQELNNKELAALLAVQAHNFNLQYSGYEYNNNVYGGLVAALKRYDSLPIRLKSHSSILDSSIKRDSVRKGKDIIVADKNGDVIIVSNGIIRKKLSFHQAKVEQIKFSSSRKFMVTVSKDMTLCIWNLSDLTSHPLVIKESASIEGVAFSSDETQIIVSVGKQQIIHAWPLQMETMARKLCSCIKQNMTLEEWEQYVGKNDVATGIPYQSTCHNYPPRK